MKPNPCIQLITVLIILMLSLQSMEIYAQPNITIFPPQIHQQITPHNTNTRTLEIMNTGDDELYFDGYYAPFGIPEPGGLSYCEATGGCGSWISRVILEQIDTLTFCSAYENYDYLFALLVTGLEYQITVQTDGVQHPDNWCAVWIDWDHDRFFTWEERIVLEATEDPTVFTGIMVPPADAENGATTMRVLHTREEMAEPCGTFEYGEAEDYLVDVATWISVDNTSGTIAPGDTAVLNFTFNSEQLDISNYLVNFRIQSNDADQPELDMLAMLHVMDLVIFFYPEEDTICEGDSTQISILVFGGSEDYTYEWSSSPPGFYSTEKDPYVKPDQTTIYTVTVTDGNYQRSGSTIIVVDQLPDNPEGVAGPVTVDNYTASSSEFSVVPVVGATHYEWHVSPENAGSVNSDQSMAVISWASGYSGLAEVSVFAINDCGAGEMSDPLPVAVYSSQAVGEGSLDEKALVYPNPTSGKFELIMPEGHEYEVELMDIYGKVVRRFDQGVEFDISDFPQGVYIVRIFSDNGMVAGLLYRM